jgi:hypothetical protein
MTNIISTKDGIGDARMAGVVAGIMPMRSLTEETFLALGHNLESASGTLQGLTATFEGLLDELANPELRQATADMAEAASGVGRISGTYEGERRILDSLAAAIAAIEGHVRRMRKAIGAVDMLGVSARIEVTHIGDKGDFASFARDIDHSLKLAQVNLLKLSQEIDVVRGHVDKAKMGEAAFEDAHAETLKLLPPRLMASVDAIALHRERAFAATSAVAERSREIAARVGEAVMALQIGDITRQRIEHVEDAVALIDDIGGGSGDWETPETERSRLVALGCRLQAAQLRAAADEFDQEIGRISTSLDTLTKSAAEIATMGEAAYGGARGGSFLLDLEADVDRARLLLEGFRLARTDADRVVAAVHDAAARLADQIGTLRSLEAGIRIVGLNATLKCRRLGDAGRPLSIIAQELRHCAHVTADEADGTKAGLERMLESIGRLLPEGETRQGDDIEAIRRNMDDAISHLGAAGRTLAAALTAQQRDSESVAALLCATIQHLAGHEEIGTAMRRAAVILEALAAQEDTALPEGPATDRMLTHLAAAYTMAQERTVHAATLGQPMAEAAAPMPAGAGAVEAAIDDFLF